MRCNVENTVWHDEGFAIDSSFRIELREFYVHDAAWAQPGGGGYAISLSGNSRSAHRERHLGQGQQGHGGARSAGAASVVGYNYMDMGYINTIPGRSTIRRAGGSMTPLNRVTGLNAAPT
jgi:hypothetical protein